MKSQGIKTLLAAMVPVDWQTGVEIPIFKKGEQKGKEAPTDCRTSDPEGVGW